MSEDEIRKEFEKLYVACANSSDIYRNQYGEYESIEAGMAWWGYLAAWNAALEAAAKVCENNIVVIALRGGTKSLTPRNMDEGSSGDGDVYGRAIRALKHTPEQSNGK